MVIKSRPPQTNAVNIDQFEKMPEFEGPYQLINGSIVEKMAGDQHSRVARLIDKRIMFFDPDDKFGLTWRDATIKVAGEDGNGRKPDLAYIIASRVPAPQTGSLMVMPDLVVEVWSPSDVAGPGALKSTRLKMLYWPTHNVKITWCINPDAKEVEILYAGQITPTKTLGIEDTLDGENIIPGFKLPVADLFA